MHWQDLVISTGLVAFTIALIPSIRSKDKPALWTSILTSGFMYIFSFTYLTLGLYATSAAQLAGAGAWTILAVQKYNQMRRPEKVAKTTATLPER